jgi:4-hydroxy-tetrahydrodipicolinate synthase
MSFDGVWTMLATPMMGNGDLALDKLAPYIENQVASGIAGVMALGSTGEFYALDASERRAVLTEVARLVDGRIMIAAGANAGSTREVIDNVGMAADAGFPTVLLAPPYYSNPDQDHLAQHFEAVAAAVEINIILYDNPAQAGVEIGLGVIERLAANPRFVALKEASGRVQRAFAIRERFGDRFELLSGVDDLALDLMFWGARCWMSGPSNFLAAEFVAIHTAAMADDWDSAREQMALVLPLITEIESGKYLSRVKYCANRVGLDVGPTRGPVFDLEPDEARRLDDMLRAVGKIS